MRIKKIYVENFKSFKKLAIENLLDVNMIYGYNNSGKSNLFKFLQLVFSSPEYSSQKPISETNEESSYESRRQSFFWDKEILNQPFIFRRESTSTFDVSFSITIELDLEFLQQNLAGYQKLKTEYFKTKSQAETVELIYEGAIERRGNYQAHQKITKVVLNNKSLFSLSKDGASKYFEGRNSSLNYRDFEALMFLFSDCILFLDNDRYFINESEASSEDSLSAKNFKNKMFSLSLTFIKENDYRALNNFLRSFLINSADAVFNNNEKSSPFKNFQFEFIRVGKEIEVILANDFGKFPLSSFGTGIQQIIFILTKIFLDNKKIILIEEIELNLSPKYQIELISFIYNKLIQKKTHQLFYTTHSPLLCYRSQFRTLQSRIDVNGISTIEPTTPNKEDAQKFVEAVKLLEHYHPPVVKKQVVKKSVIAASIKKSQARKASNGRRV